MPGLDGKGKMSKSDGNGFSITASSEEVWKALQPAFTDPARKRRTDPGNPEICPIGQIHRLVSPDEDVKTIEHGCRTAGIGCVDCKRVLHKNLDVLLGPIRERNSGITEANIDEALASGAERVRARVGKTTAMVKERMGL